MKLATIILAMLVGGSGCIPPEALGVRRTWESQQKQVPEPLMCPVHDFSQLYDQGRDEHRGMKRFRVYRCLQGEEWLLR